MNSVRPFQTKLMGVDQISQFRPNFTISAKFHNAGILGIPGVRAVSQFLRCFLFCDKRSAKELTKKKKIIALNIAVTFYNKCFEVFGDREDF